jgi:hypothetical protein
MTDTLGRIVARIPAATVSSSNLFGANRALGAGTGHVFVTSDLNHLMNVTATGPVLTHQGGAFWRGYLGQPAVGSPTPPTPPQPGDIVWTPTGIDLGALNYVTRFRVPLYDPATLPVLRARFWWVAPLAGGDTIGAVLCVGLPTPNNAMRFDSTTSTSTTGGDVTLEVAFTSEDLEAVAEAVTLGATSTGAQTVGEPVSEMRMTAWLGFYCDGNKNSSIAYARGVTLSLEAP